MKAFLKRNDGSFCPLSPKVTTIGREGCDVTIQIHGVDQQHAVIEYSEQEDCYVLQDLNTAQGTYVNDVRVQNAAVRLAPGDVIRFGYSGTPYELQLENPPPIVYPAVQQRPAWTQPLTILNDQPIYTHQQQITHGLPYLPTNTAMPVAPTTSWGQTPTTVWGQASTTTWGHVSSHQAPPLPRPPLRSRPHSAGSGRRATVETRTPSITGGTTVGSTVQRTATTSGVTGWMAQPPSQTSGVTGWTGQPPSQTSGVTGWTGQPPSQTSGVTSWTGQPPSQTSGVTMRNTTNGTSSTPDIMLVMQEKEQKILQLSEEVNHLRANEFETYRKDQLLQQLQQQNSDLQTQLHQEPAVIMSNDAELTNKLLMLENEVTMKKNEIAALKEQVGKMKTTDSSENPSQTRLELIEKTKELNNVRNELERVKKDKNITSGLVTQMQRDMSSKDSSISRLTREIEMLKKEVRDREVQLSAANSKIAKLKEQQGDSPSTSPKPKEDRSDPREKELISLRQKFKTAESKISEQHDLISNLREELDKTKQSLFDEKDVSRKHLTEIDSLKSQFLDMQRTERVVRVDMEQATKRLERFRNRVIQATFSTPGIKAPETEITDDELIETMKKLIDERTDLTKTIQDLEEQLKLAKTGTEELLECGNKLKNKLYESVNRLKENGRHSDQLKQEMTVLQSVTTEEQLQWIRDIIVEVATDEQTWEQDIENALEKCGINLSLSNEAPAKHIELLHAKWESAIGEKDRLAAQISELEEHHKAELKLQLDALKEDLENKLTDAVERAKLKGEENLNRAIDEIRAVETEKRENSVAAERKKIAEMELMMEQLRQTLTERQEEDKEKLEQAAQALAQLASYQALESELREQLQNLEDIKNKEAEQLRLEKEEQHKKYDNDVTAYKEQIKQHSVTICAMEERVVKISKKNKDYQEEVAELKKNIHELQTKQQATPPPKPVLPPKPKVIIQRPTEELAAMEHLVGVLRHENSDLKKQLHESQDVIMGLRHDLTGASARLSDITGELSEAQKQEMEQKIELLSQKDKELTEVRQQLAKLSKIIDKQKEEIKSMENNLNKEKSLTSKFRESLEERTENMRDLEVRLSEEKEEQRKQLELMDQEGRITSELSSLGAQCRGERHEQVIMRQREALAELRQRVKTLEVARPPLPTQDQALQQVVVLKKELAEMRANQAIAEDRVLQNATSLDRQVHKARGLITPVNVEADMERSAHRETMDALECSESTYLTLLRAMASCLELEEIGGLLPMAHIPKDERDKLISERENSCALLANRINVIRERVLRKDELLQGYERDLAKLRQAQELAEHKAAQVESLANDVRYKTEESQFLRESLNRTRDRLNQEKRLNTSIKQKKTFHLENERAHINPPVSNRSQVEDPRTYAKKKAQRELLKRKNYEIKTLKSELCDRERALFDKDKRLHALDTSLGFDKQVEVLE